MNAVWPRCRGRAAFDPTVVVVADIPVAVAEWQRLDGSTGRHSRCVHPEIRVKPQLSVGAGRKGAVGGPNTNVW